MALDDPILTAYIRFRVRPMLADGATKRGLEVASGISKGYLTRILDEKRNPGGVGRTNGERLARLFGMPGGYEELLSTSRGWWEREGKQQYELIRAPEVHPDPEIAKAIAYAKPWVPADILADTLHRLSGVTGETWDWWLSQIAKRVRALEQDPRGAERVAMHRAKVDRSERKEIRDVKAELAEKRRPAPSSNTAKRKRRAG